MELISIILFIGIFACSTTTRVSGGDDIEQQQQQQQLFYRIPNPFGGGWSGEVNKVKGYFAIDSFQSSLSSAGDNERFEVQEYFSLEEGLTFSLQQNHDQPDKVFAIIGDSNHGKTYIVSRSGEQDEYQCELDNVHHHRQVFPWLFKYTMPEVGAGDKDRSKRRRETTREGFIYGIGGIWLNAIHRKIISDLIGANSPMPGSNVWAMEEGDLRVRLLFDKPEPDADPEKLEALIQESTLNHIRVKRLGVVNHQGQSTRFYGGELKDIYVRGVERVQYPARDETLSWLMSFIPQCRARNRKHRVFPSLIQATSLSPNRLFSIQYVETKFPLANDVQSGTYEERRHRRVFDREFHEEWFSFKRETFSVLHQGLDRNDQDERDMFIKMFTRNKDGHKQAATTYHQVLNGGQLRSCLEGEAEHAPHDNLMVRAIHFHQGNDGHRLSGLLHGLGALLMNAVDFHHKQYSLFKKDILWMDDQANPDSRVRIKANEWQYTDSRSSRTVHFYFRHKNIRRQNHDIGDLVRVDIKQAVKLADEDTIPPTRATPDLDSGDDPGLMIKRFDIIGISFEARADEIEAALKPAEMCLDGGTDDGDDEDGDDFSQNDDDFSDLMEKFNRVDLDGFEFVPGKMLNSLEFPDFFESLDGGPAYTVESSLTIVSADSNEPKFVYLREHVDLETEQTVLSLFLKEELTVPDVEYYINYNSETIFKVVVGGSGATSTCKRAEDVDEDWLRVLSAELKYYRVPRSTKIPSDPDTLKQVAVIESSRLRSHGVGALWRQAASSPDSDFVGLKKEVILRGDPKFKEVVWSWNPAGGADDDDQFKQKFQFNFYWNLSQWRQDREQNLDRRTIELLSINSIQYGDSDDRQQQSQEGAIRMIRVHPISIRTSQSAAWLLPGSCSAALEEAEKETQVLMDDIQFPPISDFFSGSYETHYTITHSSMSNLPDGSNTLSIVESFDRDKNRAKIITTADDRQNKDDDDDDKREIYIDGQSKKIYALLAKENTCKRLARLEGLVNFGATNSLENRDFMAERMYGLGALWTRLAELQGPVLKVTHRYSANGLKQEVRTYQVRTTFSSSATETLEYQVKMRFVANVADWLGQQTELGVMVKRDPRFVLEMIDLIPRQVRGRRRAELHRSTLEVSSLVSLPNVDWALPEICSSTAPDVVDSFPRISELLLGENGDVFHMRSEITSSTPLVGAGKSLFILDEWFYSGKEKIRLKSSRMAQSLDVLLFVDSEESFDLSVAYQCPTILPRMFSSAAKEDANQTTKVMKFWRDETTLVDRLAELYFGPVSLWWLAEKNLANVELANKMDLAPLPTARADSEPAMMSREREMRLECWSVTSPPEVRPAWRFEMRFEKLNRSETDGSSVEWHSLESISLTDPDHLGLATEAQIDIISSKHEEAPEETMLDTFMLPEGYGCPRSNWVLDWMRRSSDDVAFTTDSEHRISYEASLELMSPDNNSLVVMPTLSGRMLSSGWGGKNETHDEDKRTIDVMAHYCRSRLPNGQTRSSKSVHDRSNNLYFDIDRSTGFCAIDRVKSHHWALQFSGALGEFESERITLDRDTFKLLFLDTVGQGFVPINQWNYGGLATGTYELEVDNLKLSEQLQGPAIVIRRYENLEWSPPAIKYERGRLTRQHDSLSVKVLLFSDRSRGQLKAKFGIRLRKAFNVDLSELLNSINVAQCYNDGSPTSDKRSSMFVFEYDDIKLDAMEWVVFNNEIVKDLFTHQLVQRARIMPIQFVANPEIDFARFEPTERTLIMGFTLLDPPTAIEYFEGGPRMDLDERYASVGELRLVENIHVCSKWCDRIDCTAMTYCESRLCRVVTDNMVQGELLAMIKQGKASTKSGQCSLFYFGRTKFDRPQTMENFASFADFAINEGQNLAEAFALDFDGGQVWPSKFIAQTDDFWSFREDTVSPNSGYILVSSDQSLDSESIHRLHSGVEANMVSIYAASHSQENSYAECLAKCSATGCVLVSYSERLAVCQTVAGCTELRPLLSGALRKEDPSDRYTITARNYLNEYVRFDRTQEPNGSMLKLENYSPLECAAACSSLSGSSSKCLSFDHCRHAASPAGLCYLQSSHIVLDLLDGDVLTLGSTQLTAGEASCEHYSRSVAADFKKLANRRYIDEGLIERGLDLERCAMNCHENELCGAFEYCFDDTHKPSQSCLLISHLNTQDCDNFEDLLFPAASCSVYKLEDTHPRQDAANLAQSEPAPVGLRRLWSRCPNWAAALLTVFVALIMGLTTQLALYRLFPTRAVLG